MSTYQKIKKNTINSKQSEQKKSNNNKENAKAELAKNDENKKSHKTLKELDKKTKRKVILYIVITFGIFYFILDQKLNKKEKEKKELKKNTEGNKKANKENITKEEIKDTSKLKQSKKNPIDNEKIIKNLGGKDNIVKIENTLSTIQFYVIDKTKVNKDEIKKIFNGKGISIVDKKYSIVCGDYANTLKEEIIKKIKKGNNAN